jgi:hypothetical protein
MLIDSTRLAGFKITKCDMVCRVLGPVNIIEPSVNLVLVSGFGCHNPGVWEDYNVLRNAIIPFGQIPLTSLTYGEEFRITLNAAGLKAFNQYGLTWFGFRLSSDIQGIAPPQGNLVEEGVNVDGGFIQTPYFEVTVGM